MPQSPVNAEEAGKSKAEDPVKIGGASKVATDLWNLYKNKKETTQKNASTAAVLSSEEVEDKVEEP